MSVPSTNLGAEKTRRCQSEPTLHGVNCFRAHLVFCMIVNLQKQPPLQLVQLELANANTTNLYWSGTGTDNGGELCFIAIFLESCTEPE